ncbi:hypothetical protein A1Q1_04688 [Trichosporon asahii var. asahii CBS 2479]|uniref:Uncharacterized protein n=1 Tax=Trichosporon asahii var. asahii (strain ATCC 90039 / CBS 2479 / JCM 2466 / KCTC 7840 / NBRC 103889/ NCYC 2677 / UAMH 7654) TaxID=1186058 RepID=J5QCZ4_TRIAS|nr:hypothetical protein A1Q1_04688 [Trichosporon asahii var. asahii CBS 2479]EJT46723.1 hypothetical protein A1Q1_04688 [Trichosporon asahii var. asahii CBS 2479]
MPGLAPRKPPIKAYPLLIPDKKRLVDAAPAVEREVFAWLLLAASQDEGWTKRKHPCLVCEKSGWPCLDPESRGSRTRCEGCFCAGYHCQSIPSRPAPSTLAPLTPPNTRSHHRKADTSGPGNRRTSSSDEPMDIDESPTRGKDKMPKKLARRRVASSESDPSSDSSVAVSSRARRKAPTNNRQSKRYRISSPAVQQDSSDIEFVSTYQPETSRPAHPMTPISPREPMRPVIVNHTQPTAPPRKSAAESFLELLGTDSSSDDENSTDSSGSAPLPPRPMPVRPIPILSASRTNRESPVHTLRTVNTIQPAITPRHKDISHHPAATLHKPTSDQQFGASDNQGNHANAAPSWKYSQREPSTPLTEVDSQRHNHSARLDIEEDELDVDVKEERNEESHPSASSPDTKIRKKPLFSKTQPTAQSAQQPNHPSSLLLDSSQQLTIPVVRRILKAVQTSSLLLDSSQQLTIPVVRWILKAVQTSADPSFCLSINGETAGPAKDKTVIVVSEAELPQLGTVPWHVLFCERSSSTITVIYKLQEPHHSNQHRLYSTALLSRTIPRAFRNGLAVPKHPKSVLWKACRELDDFPGPLWATCLAIWLTRDGDLNGKLGSIRNIRFGKNWLLKTLTSSCRGSSGV